MDMYSKANDRLYWISVWVLPLSAILATFVVAFLASTGGIGVNYYPRFGAICVVAGLFAEAYLQQPRYKYEEGWFVPKDPPARKASRYRYENVILSGAIVNGTIVWAFGDLIV